MALLKKKLAVFCQLLDVTQCTFFTFQLTLVSRGAACRHKLKFTRCLHQKNWILARQKKQTYIFLALETSFCIFSESTICHSCEKSRETVDWRVFRHYIFVSVWKKAGKMGAYLSEPITKKEIETSEDDNFWVSSASMQGWRTNQEVIF